ncbi:hypothetical protein DPMN_193035, partial [Dreissena polymorpha]
MRTRNVLVAILHVRTEERVYHLACVTAPIDLAENNVKSPCAILNARTAERVYHLTCVAAPMGFVENNVKS